MPTSDAGRFVAVIIAGVLCTTCIAAQTNEDFQRGMAEFRTGNYSAAASSFDRSEKISPGSTDALLYKAKCLIHLEDFPGAEKSLRDYLIAHTASSDAEYLLGFVLHRQNRPAESLATYTQAAALTPPTGDDLKIVGLDYVLLDDYPDAIKWLEKATEFDARNTDAWYYLGRACYANGRLGEARKAFERLLDLAPHDVRAENNLGLILETEGQPAAAIEAYRRAIKWQEQNLYQSAQPYVNLGNLLMEQGRAQEALTPLQRAIELAPDDAYCHVKLGVYYRKAGQLEGAQRELVRAAQLAPSNAAIHYQLGRLFKEIHATDRAQAEFDRAAELETRAAGSRASPADH
ncbi:MAG TPA: tetratricopeptide repeat protein [Candidatus Dormibacteraeota bacterium]|nr:tetratricopeptide repeat protein [Candidatus Dormibacteraeota bacterium]